MLIALHQRRIHNKLEGFKQSRTKNDPGYRYNPTVQNIGQKRQQRQRLSNDAFWQFWAFSKVKNGQNVRHILTLDTISQVLTTHRYNAFCQRFDAFWRLKKFDKFFKTIENNRTTSCSCNWSQRKFHGDTRDDSMSYKWIYKKQNMTEMTLSK